MLNSQTQIKIVAEDITDPDMIGEFKRSTHLVSVVVVVFGKETGADTGFNIGTFLAGFFPTEYRSDTDYPKS